MPLLTADEAVQARPRRVLVAGTSGAGKTSWAARLGQRLGIPQVELDALHHGPGWVPRPEFEQDVRHFAAQDAWVCEWQYAPVRELLAERAELVLWLDLPVPVVIRQVVVRTLRRRLTRQELWNGNVEPSLATLFTDRDHIIRWAWRSRHNAARRMEQLLVDRPELPVVQVRSHREASAWLTRLTPGPAAPGRP